MEMNGVTSQPTPIGSPNQKNDSSTELQKLEQLKKNIQQQLKQLEQDKQGGNALKNTKDKLQKQLKEIDQQILVLKQQAAQEVQKTAETPTKEGAKLNPPRFDQYAKNNKEAPGTGIYSMEQDENGNVVIVFDNPKKPMQELKDLQSNEEKRKAQKA